jgi:hypothetical protein
MVRSLLFLQAIPLLSANYLFPFITIFPPLLHHFLANVSLSLKPSHSSLPSFLNRFLIVSDSMSSIKSLISYPFNLCLSPLILSIKNILFSLNQANFTIKFLWAPSHSGILDNEIAYNLTRSTSSIAPCKILFSDFIPILRQHINHLWLSYWNSLLANFAFKYKSVVPVILKKKKRGSLILNYPEL